MANKGILPPLVLPSDYANLQSRVGEWAEKTFPKATNMSICNHLVREVRELEEYCLVPDKYNDSQTLRQEMGSEIADCIQLLYHIAHRNGIDVNREVILKFNENQKRRWNEPDSDGVSEHVK